jgi:hypothetical protein
MGSEISPLSIFVRLTAKRYRRTLIAAIATLLTSVICIGLVAIIQWRGRQAVRSDTHTTVNQTAQQLVRSLESRRGTLTFLRDTLNRQPNLSLLPLSAMGASAVEHTRHLLGTGLIRASEQPVWWSGPQRVSPADLSEVNRAIVQRTRLRRIWRVHSTFVVRTRSRRPFLVMLEPLRAPQLGESAIIGLFDLAPLLRDFFASA